MNKQDNPLSPESELDDASIEALLRQVGVRDEPSAQVMQEVRSAVHAEWQATVRARKRQRQFIGFAMAAGIACAAVTAMFTLRSEPPPLAPVATVARIEGHLQIVGDAAYEVMVGQRISTGSTVRTDASTHAALDFGHGVSVRMDADSSVRVAALDRIVLEKGALYIDAGALAVAGHQDTLKIETSAGVVRHLGTQYQVRALNDEVVIAVREGRVEIRGEHGTNVGDAGEQLRVSNAGNVQRSRLSTRDASWQWAQLAAPVFEIADQPLSSFLAWVARETGRRLVYENSQVEALAHSVRLRGSINGLSADAALAAVLPTTSLRLEKAEDDSIRIGLAAPIESGSAVRPTP